MITMNSAERRNDIICYVVVLLNLLVTTAVFYLYKEMWLSFMAFVICLVFVRSPERVEKATRKDAVMLILSFVVIFSLFLWSLLSYSQSLNRSSEMETFVRSTFSFLMLSSFVVVASQTAKVSDGITSWLYQFAFFPLTMNVGALLNSAPAKFIPYIIGLGVLNVVVFFIFLYVGSVSFRNPHSRFSKVASALKMIALSAVLALSIAVPVSALRQSMKDMDLPSIGDFPAVSTSNEVVFKAVFTSDKVPQKPYWVYYPEQYVFPLGEYEWDKWSTLQKKQDVTGLLYDNQAASQLVSLNQGEYTYSKVGSNGRFYLEGSYDFNYVPANISSQNRKYKESPELGGSIRVSAFVDYQDKQVNGLTEGLKTVYLSIPSTPYIPTTVDMSGAAKNMPKTYELVRQWRSEGLTDQEFIDRTLTYFSENMAYNFDYQSMDPDKNRVDYFVFEEKKGVCRHFANTFAMMMRMGGVPSRLVGGFAGGEYNSADNSWSVRKRDAHVWTEVWLEGQGWVKIDPTLAVRVEKGIPETRVDVMSSWFNQWTGSFSKINWSDKFSTAGTSNENTSTNGMSSLLGGMTLKVPGWLIAVGGIFILIGAFVFLRSRGNKKQPEDIAWDKLKVKLKRMGYALNENIGPHTLGLLVVEDLEPAMKSKWLTLIEDYQRWKFGDQDVPNLAKQINWVRRNIKIKSK